MTTAIDRIMTIYALILGAIAGYYFDDSKMAAIVILYVNSMTQQNKIEDLYYNLDDIARSIGLRKL